MKKTKTEKEYKDSLKLGVKAEFLSNDDVDLVKRAELIEEENENKNNSYLVEKTKLGKNLPVSTLLPIEEYETVEPESMRLKLFALNQLKRKEPSKLDIWMIPVHRFLNNNKIGKYLYYTWRKYVK